MLENSSTKVKASLFILRVSIGWLFLYAGVTKVLDPSWSAAGYLKGATTFTALYGWFSQPDIVPMIDFLNEWGLTLLGLSLIFGLFVRLSSVLGASLMLLYYFSVLSFPYAGTHSFLVDEHIIYALLLIFLGLARADRVWGLAKFYPNIKLKSGK